MVSGRLLPAVLALAICTAVSHRAQPRSFSRRPLSTSQPSAANCTWVRFSQPLSHFAPGVTQGATFEQRICVYDKFWSGGDAPVFFYVGNESPVDEYVNGTGLMWELGAELGALLVWAEHRYFGESMPTLEGMPNCLAYLSSEEAMADYASLISALREDEGLQWHAPESPVIAFGGSYGGMLAAWFRMRYPSHVAGAIAGSAPIWGLPLTRPQIDGAAVALSKAFKEEGGSASSCAPNLKAAWILLHDSCKTEAGRARVSQSLGLCTPLRSSANVNSLISYLQAALFTLAEGSYPFASDYIDYATFNGTTAKLPAWPAQKLCEPLARDFGVVTVGDVGSVRFSIHAGPVEVTVDWNETQNNGYSVEDLEASGALDLFEAAARGLNVWFNVTGTEHCLEWAEAQFSSVPAPAATPVELAGDTSRVCGSHKLDAGLGWGAICCNEGITMANTLVQGIGRDVFWPPNAARGATLEDVVRGSMSNCGVYDKLGLYGTPAQPDEFGVWLDTLYGGKDIGMHTNIFFSNGGLDPWSSGGVLPPGPTRSLPAGFMPMAGHHLDLFFSDINDPEPVRAVRAAERASILTWIEEARLARRAISSGDVALSGAAVEGNVSFTAAFAVAAAIASLVALAWKPGERNLRAGARPLLS